MTDEEDQIHRGVGSICIAAASLEWSLAYCSSVLLRRGDDWFRQVAGKTGKPIEAFSKLVAAIEAHEPAEHVRAAKLSDDAKRLLDKRHRVVHSVMMGELELGSRIYEAWHPRSNDFWPVVPAQLDSLAGEIWQCRDEVDAFGTEWEARADRDGWPDLDARLRA